MWLSRLDYRLGMGSIPSWGTFLIFFYNNFSNTTYFLSSHKIKLGHRPLSRKPGNNINFFVEVAKIVQLTLKVF